MIFTTRITLVILAKFAGFTLEKGENHCLLKFYKTAPVGRSRRYFTEFFEVNVSACFSPLIRSVLTFLRSKKEKTVDFALLRNDLGVFFPVTFGNFADFSFDKGENN